MIHESTYRKPDLPRFDRPIVDHFDVDARILEARVGNESTSAPVMRNLLLNLGAMLLADVLALGAAVSGASWILTGSGPVDLPNWAPVFLASWVGVAALQRLYPGWGVGPVERMRGHVRGMIGALAVTFSLPFLTGLQVDTDWTVTFAAALLALPLVALARGVARTQLERTGRWGVNTVIYGTSQAASRVAQLLGIQRGVGFRPVGIFEDDPRMWGRNLCGVPVLGDANLVHPDAPVAVVTGDGGKESRAQVDFLLKYYREVVYVPDLLDQSTSTTQTVDFGGLLGLRLRVNLASRWARSLKRTLDLLATVLTFPFWAGIVGVGAALVWLGDRQNPFYRQTRVGRAGRPISVLKLRTMVANADQALEEALARDPALKIEWEATSKLQNDPRITRVGKVLRRLSIDELPQLVNVLRGEMALVGPRPLPAYHESRLDPEALELRRRVRPGVTGLWQISGRSNTGDDGIEWLDAYYVRSWTPWLDVAILLRTFRAAMAGEGAY